MGAESISFLSGRNEVEVSSTNPLPVVSTLDQTVPGTTNAVTITNASGTVLDTSLPSEVVGDVAHDGADSGKPVKIGGKSSSAVPTAVSTGDRVNAWFTNEGALVIAAASYPGSAGADNINGLIGLGRRDGVAANPEPLFVSAGELNKNARFDRPTKAHSTSRLLSSANTTNGTLVKNSRSNLHRVHGYCAASAPIFLKLYDKASAPTVGTDVPVITIRLANGAYFDHSWGSRGRGFDLGIGYAITGVAADNDTTAIASGDVLCLNVEYGFG